VTTAPAARDGFPGAPLAIWSRRRIAGMKQLLVLALLVALLPACGGGGKTAPSTAPATTAAPNTRAELESRLDRTSVGICNGECRTYHASAATCSGGGVEIDGRTYYRCRVEYEAQGRHRAPPDEFCAALDPAQGHVARPLGDC
jgi:hypothetical protein